MANEFGDPRATDGHIEALRGQVAALTAERDAARAELAATMWLARRLELQLHKNGADLTTLLAAIAAHERSQRAGVASHRRLPDRHLDLYATADEISKRRDGA